MSSPYTVQRMPFLSTKHGVTSQPFMAASRLWGTVVAPFIITYILSPLLAFR